MRLSAAMVFLSMLLCACTEASQNQELPAATYMGGKDTIAGICEELESAGASHVDTFREWTTDFADTAGKNAGLEDSWSDPGKMKADIGKCMDGWEQNHDYSDADCRMTAFLLLDGVLRAESTEDSYEGTYLMFDTEAIDNVDRYESIKENKNMFTTLYGEKNVTDGSRPENTFSDSWKHYGFQVDSDRLSLLSIVIYDPYSDVVFVGHTGVLIKYSDYYLFIEKIAFEQPYQATRVHNMDELLDIMSLRPEYFGEEGEAGPFVYCNGEYLGTLKKNI
ncbi:MAG TPA: DUF4300 domain-containing protein [Roseburia sp.]|nr:DUF4300 domain-containing protein [Roseburia sp.]